MRDVEIYIPDPNGGPSLTPSEAWYLSAKHTRESNVDWPYAYELLIDAALAEGGVDGCYTVLDRLLTRARREATKRSSEIAPRIYTVMCCVSEAHTAVKRASLRTPR